MSLSLAMQMRMNDAPNDNLAFQGRLNECVRLAGGKANKLAKISGIPLNTLLRYFQGTEPPRNNLVAIADSVKMPVGWLAGGDPLLAPATPSVDLPSEAPRYGEDYVQIPWIIGSKRDQKGERVILFEERRAWLPLKYVSDGIKGGNPRTLAAYRMKGNEMEPDVLDGEVIVIDTSERKPNEGMLAVRIRDQITVRDVVQLSPETYAFRHERSLTDHEGIRFSADSLGYEFDILGRIIVVFRYPVRRSGGSLRAAS